MTTRLLLFALMETARTTVLFLPIIAGFTALTIGLIPFIAKKGGKLHITTGMVFYYAMVFVSISAFGLAAYRFNPFLLMVGLLTLYSTVIGYRGLQLMQQKASGGQQRDWALLIFCVMALGLTIWQTVTRFGTNNTGIFILISVFAGLLGVQLPDLRYVIIRLFLIGCWSDFSPQNFRE